MIELFLMLVLSNEMHYLQVRHIEGFHRDGWAAQAEAAERGVPLIEWVGGWPRTQALEDCVHVFYPYTTEKYLSVWQVESLGLRYAYLHQVDIDTSWGDIKRSLLLE